MSDEKQLDHSLYENSDEFSAWLIESLAKERVQRNEQYTTILNNYAVNQKSMHALRKWFKIIFFIVVCLSFVAIIFAGIFLICATVSNAGNLDGMDLGTILTAIAGIISAIIILPSTIAKHLFPPNGDFAENDLVEMMQRFDNDSSKDDLNYEHDLHNDTDNDAKNTLDNHI